MSAGREPWAVRAWRRVVGPPAPETDLLGRRGERIAARFLRRQRYRILGRNLRVPMGEADILAVAPDRRTIVLVEVKTRTVSEGGSEAGTVHFGPETAVTADKRATLDAILMHLSRANHWHDRPRRIDIIAVELPHGGTPIIRHHVGSVQGRVRYPRAGCMRLMDRPQDRRYSISHSCD
jgi:putative endonuclease